MSNSSTSPVTTLFVFSVLLGHRAGNVDRGRPGFYHAIKAAILAAIAICWVSYSSGNLLGGWNGATFWDGGARISYSFIAGLLIYRSGWIINNKLGFIAMALLLVLAFIMPFSTWNWLSEPLVVLFYFPLLIALVQGQY